MIDKPISERLCRKLIPRVCSALEGAYGKREPAPTQRDPLDDLIVETLAENSAAKDASRAFRDLRKSFVDWNEARVSRAGEIQRLIGPIDEAPVKAQNVLRTLNSVFNRSNNLSLFFLLDAGPRQARDFLAGLEGVSEEIAARLMLHSLGYPAVAVTPAIARVSRRLGLVTQESSPEEMRKRLDKIVPTEHMYSFHELVSDHGRRSCLASGPKCSRCAIKRYCRAGKALKSRGRRT